TSAQGGDASMEWNLHRLLGLVNSLFSKRPRDTIQRPALEPLEERWVPTGCVVTENTCFAIIGDYSAGTPARDVSNLVKGWNPDFIITTGDTNYPDGQASTIDANIGQYYHEFISPYLGSYGAGSA